MPFKEANRHVSKAIFFATNSYDLIGHFGLKSKVYNSGYFCYANN